MAGLRDTEAQVSVNVSGISELERLNEMTNKAVSSLTKLDEVMSRGFGMSGSGFSRINEETKLASENVTRFRENLDKTATASSSISEKLQRGNSALSEQLSMSERLSASSAKIAENKAKEAVANDKTAISAEKLIQQQNRSVETENKKLISAEKVTQETLKSIEAEYKLSQAKSKDEILTAKAANAQEKEAAAIEKSVAATEKLASAKEKNLALAEKYKAQTNAINQAEARAAMAGASGGGHKEEGRLKSAAKESMALFAPGMLLASGVMKGAEYVQDLFKEGAKYNSEVSGMGGTWGTLVDGALGEGISKKEAGSAKEITAGIQNTSRTTGRSLDLVNEGYQQMYHATESAERTKHLVHSEMMVADAMNMSDAQASRFAMYGVGHSLDRGYVTGGAMNQMVQYAPALNSALTRAYLAKTEHKDIKDVDEKDVEKTKGDLRTLIKHKQVSADMLEDAMNYLGDDKFKHAAENAQKTIPGMVRSFENGLPRLVGKFESSFLEPLGKKTSGLFEKATQWINGTDSDKWAESVGKGLSEVTVKFTSFSLEVANGAGKLWKATSQFRSGFADGFVSEFGKIKGAVGDTVKFIGKQYDGLISMLPKGSDKKAKEIGELTGKVSAFLLALRMARKLPVIGKPFEKMLGYASELAGKLPIIGGSLSKLIGGKPKVKAGNKMMTAADTMMAAANKMAGTSGLSGSDVGGNFTKGRVVSGEGKFTLGQKVANSKLGAGIDKMYLKGVSLAGKGGIKGAFGKKLMSTSETLGKFSLEKAGKLSEFGTKIGGTKLGRFAVGTGKLGKNIIKRGGGGINAAFAGFDIYSAMKNNKAGSKGRHEGVGGAVGAGIGGTAGAALGSLIGPVGTIAGGMAGSWLGDKAGRYVGSNWNGITKGFKGAQSWADKTGSKLFHSKGLYTEAVGASLKLAAHPIENTGKAFDKIQNKFKNFKMPDMNKVFRGAQSEVDKFGSGIMKHGGLAGMIGGGAIKLASHPLQTAKGIGSFLSDPGKAFKNFKMPKLQMPKIENPFKKWKMPKIDLPKISKMDNPFKNWKLPNIKWPNLGKMKNPFSGWKMPNIKLPKLPKVDNPFKNWKMPKITFPKLPNWLSKLNPFGGAKSSAKGASNEAKKVSKSSSKASNSIKKTGSSAKKAGKEFSSSFKNAFDKAKSGAKSFGTKISSSSKSAFSKLSSNVKSSMNKANSSAKSGSKSISNSIKNGLKNASNGSKSALNKLSSNVKSSMNKAKSSAKSGSKGIGTAIKSNLKSVGNAGKSEFNKLTSSVKSGINKAKSAANSGSKSIGNSVKNGLKNVGSAGKSEFNKLSSSVTSGMNKAKSAASSGASGIGKAVSSGLKNASSSAKSAMNGFVSAVQSGLSRAQSSASSGASKIVSSINSGLSKLGSVATSGFNKMGSSMTSAMSKVSSSATSGMNAVTNAIQSGGAKAVSVMTGAFGKMASIGTSSSSKVASSISGIGSSASAATSKVNGLASAINGIHSKTVTITANVEGKGANKLATGTSGALAAFSRVPAYAKGSGGGHKGGLALVNDGQGENYREAYMLPNGFVGLFPKKRNMLVDLPAGAHVLNGDDTKRKFGSGLTRYAEGTNGAVEAINSRKQSTANNATGNAPKNKTNQKVSIGKIEINITDNSGNAKDMTDEIARQVEKKLEDVLRKFNSNFEALGA